METALYVFGAIFICVVISMVITKLGFNPKPPKNYEDYTKGGDN